MTKINLRISVIILLILLAALSRLLPHPPNFAPIGAMALFGSAYFSKRYLTFLIPLLSLYVSDLVLNNVVYGQYYDHFVWWHQGAFWTYGAFVAIGLLGVLCLRKVKASNVILASLSASILFFLTSNFGVWMSGTMYPINVSGLLNCYMAGIPFFQNTLLGDLVYCGVLFGSFEIVQYKIPQLRTV